MSITFFNPITRKRETFDSEKEVIAHIKKNHPEVEAIVINKKRVPIKGGKANENKRVTNRKKKAKRP